MSTKTVKKVTLKPWLANTLRVFGVIFCLFLGLFLFYEKQLHDLMKLDYSKEASNNILFSLKKDYVMSVGKNASINCAFESNNYIEEYLDSYRKIGYVEHEHFIDNVNELLKKGYSTNDINIILAHGDDKAVSEFAKRDKVRYLEEFFSVSYAKLEYYDRYVAYSDTTGEDENTTVLYVNLGMDKEDYVDSREVERFSLDMLVNKHFHLKEDFVPDELVTIDKRYASEEGLKSSKVALDAFLKMNEAATSEGYSLVINSSYRSYQDQVDLINYYMGVYGKNYVDKYVARAGYSEHQTGLAFDIGSRTSNVFANSKEYQWMLDNAYKYGFIARFTKKKEAITGFREEPWHYRYVGEEIAKYIHDNNISFEEYWVLYLDK